MNVVIPKISNKINKKDVLQVLENEYSIIGPLWVSHQFEWITGIYQPFKNHNKYLILIYLIKKTFDFYSLNFTKLTYDDFYALETIEIEKISISEISKALNIPKESTRRKILELEISGIIKKIKKKTIIDKLSFKFIQPVKTLKKVSYFLSSFSNILKEEKILPIVITSQEIEEIIKNNFSYIWKLYYEMQIPMLLSWKNIFKDLETFNIWAACMINQHLDGSKNINKMNKNDFLNETIFSKNMERKDGVNAMSISDMTGIPRATVIRKLKQLVKEKNLTINDKKLYSITGIHLKKHLPLQKLTLQKLAAFSTIIYNFKLVN